MGDHAQSPAFDFHSDGSAGNTGESLERNVRSPDRPRKYLAEELSGHADPRRRTFRECGQVYPPESGEAERGDVHLVARGEGAGGGIRSRDLIVPSCAG